MIAQREIYETQINEFGVPHNVVVGFEEVEIEDMSTEEQIIAEKEAELLKIYAELQALKEQTNL